MDNLVTAKICGTRPEAEIARGLLESNGIPAVIFGDDAGGMYPFPYTFANGIEIKVKEKDLEKAKKLLASPANK